MMLERREGRVRLRWRIVVPTGAHAPQIPEGPIRCNCEKLRKLAWAATDSFSQFAGNPAQRYNVRPIPCYEPALERSFVEDPLAAVEIPEETTQAATAGGG